MKKMMTLIATLVLCGCSSTPAISELSVSKAQWMMCWERCGKKDTLLAVTPDACVCRGGYRILTATQAPGTSEAAQKAEAPGEALNIWEKLGF